MRRSSIAMETSPQIRSRAGHRESKGYILITLILFFALIAITAAAVLPEIIFEIKRDREEELIHRGTQYTRAIKRFVKKSGSYPVRLEQLDNTNQIRFLRKRYKDPLTGKDFKLLHQSDVPTLSAGLALAGAAGGVAGAAGALSGQQGQQLAGLAAQAIAAQGAQGGVQGATSPGSSLFGDQSGSEQGGAGQTPGTNGAGSSTPGGGLIAGTGDQNGQAASNGTSGDNTSNSSSSSSSSSSAQPGSAPPGAQVFGSGGPIVGVASTSKDKTIRIYNKKDHYNQWQFVYDPSIDRGGLITTPYQTPLQTNAPTLNGQPGANGTPGTNGAPGSQSTPGSSGAPGGNSPSGSPFGAPSQTLTPNDTPLQQ